MQQMIQLINSVPEFMWTNIFTVINTLICGLIVAVFIFTFLKRKEERTRIAGVIVEKRMNSEQEILHFLEHELFKEEVNIENSSKYDVIFSELLDRYGLPDPHDGHIWCSCSCILAFLIRYRLWSSGFRFRREKN